MDFVVHDVVNIIVVFINYFLVFTSQVARGACLVCRPMRVRTYALVIIAALLLTKLLSLFTTLPIKLCMVSYTISRPIFLKQKFDRFIKLLGGGDLLRKFVFENITNLINLSYLQIR